MQMRTIAAGIWLLLLSAPMNAVHAEEASVLLERYGVAVYDPVVEGEKLMILEDAYSEATREVNNQTMLTAASELADRYQARALMERDAAIYALADELSAAEEQMRASMEQDVATIMALDVRYRTVAGRLQRAREARDDWLARTEQESRLPPEAKEMEQAKSKLDKLGREVDRQKDKYAKAQSYPELGHISDFQAPLAIPAAVTSSFGNRLDPITRDAITFHQGIDLGAPEGTAVLAAFHGTVEEVSESEALGRYILLDHGLGIKTLYGHLSDWLVEAGQQVNQYDAIAKSGNTGSRTTGAHLHFGLYIGGKAVDPALLISSPGA